MAKSISMFAGGFREAGAIPFLFSFENGFLIARRIS